MSSSPLSPATTGARSSTWGPVLYRELHRIADLLFVGERSDHTLQPTALVHEVFLRLDHRRVALPRRRCEALAYAATVMRNLLVEHARKRAAAIRGGDRKRVPIGPEISIDDASVPDVLALHEAIERLAEDHPREARVVELRFFGGLGVDDTARMLEISPATVKREWDSARAWLLLQLSAADTDTTAGDQHG